jgi:O-antigen/teichoic acid export membrane protein
MMRQESLRTTLLNAYVLTGVARACDLLFFLGLLTAFLVEEVGLYSWVAAIMAFFAILLELGLSQSLVREFSQRSFGFKSAMRPSFVIRLPVLGVAAGVYLLWGLFGGVGSREYEAVGLAGAIQVLMLGEAYCVAWMKSRAHQSLANVLATCDPVGRLFVFTVLVYGCGIKGIVELLAGIFGFHLFLFITTAVVAWKLVQGERQDEPDDLSLLPSTHAFLRSSLMLGIIGLVGVVQNRLDWLIVSTYTGPVQLAGYSLANKAYEMLVLFMGVAMLTVYPWICRRDQGVLFRIRVNVILMALLIFGTSLSLGSALYLPDLLSLIWGEKYAEAGPLLQWLLPVAAISTAVVILYYQLVAREWEQALLVVSIVSAVLQLSINLWLIPRIGPIGAVAGMATLALVNVTCLSVLASRARILSSGQIGRGATFLGVMFGLVFLLWRSHAPFQWGVPAIALIALGTGCSVLFPHREQRWLKAFVMRESSNRFQLRAREA